MKTSACFFGAKLSQIMEPRRSTRMKWGRGYAVAVFLLWTSTTILRSQLSRISIDLSNTFSDLSRGYSLGDLSERRYDQLYTLGISGFAVTPRLLAFSVRSGLRDDALKSSSTMGSSSTRLRSFDLYDANVDLFRYTIVPIILYASRKTNSASYSFPTDIASSAYETTSEVTGLSANLQANGYWPTLAVALDRSTSRGNSPLIPFDTRSNRLQLTMANADDENISSYSVQYSSSKFEYVANEYASLNDARSYTIVPPRTINALSASASTNIWDDVKLGSAYDLQTRDDFVSRSTRFTTDFSTGSRLKHSTLAEQTHNSSAGMTTNSYHLIHSLGIVSDASGQGNIQGEYLASETEASGRSINFRKVSLHGSWTLTSAVYQASQLTFTAGSSIGNEAYSERGNAFTYSVMSGGKLISPILPWLRSVISQDFSFQRFFFLGRALNNRSLVSFEAFPWLATNVRLDLSRSDSRYLDQTFYPPFSSTGGLLTVTTEVIRSTSVSTTFREELQESYAQNVLSEFSLSVLSKDIVKNLMLSGTVSYARTTYPRVTTIRIHSGFTYQFYAYSLTGNYFFDTFAGYMTNGFYLTIKRQFSVDFE